MTLTIQALMPPLSADSDGVVRVAGTRIPLERVVHAFIAGATPEQIAQDFDVLTVEQVYSVVNFYLQNRREVDAYLAESEREAAATRAEIERQFDPSGIRARLLARRNNSNGE
jgi:uncharacterized protein (DUF433 family)